MNCCRGIFSVMLLLCVATIPVGALDDSNGTERMAGVAGGQKVLIDDFGEKVVLSGNPTRIVSLSPANTEILFALGLGDRVIAVTDVCTYPPEIKEKDTIGGYYTVNVEKVVASRPDLVLAEDGNTFEVIGRIREFGIPVITLDSQDINGVLADIRLVGKATGSEAEAEALVLSMEKRMDAVTGKTLAADHRPTVAHVIWYDPIWVSGRSTFQNTLISLGGGVNAFPDIEEWGIVSLEEFIRSDPDVILINSGTGMIESGHDVLYDYFVNDPRLQTLAAVRNGRIYVVESDIIDRGGPRIIDALELVALRIHPELFSAEASSTSAARSPGFGTAALIALLILTVSGFNSRNKKS